MNKKLTFKQGQALTLALAGALFMASCEKTGEPVAVNPVEEQSNTVYTDLEYTSQSAALSGARFKMESTTIGSKAYFIGGYEGTETPPISTTIDIYDATTFAWSTKTLNGADDYYRLDGSSPIQVVGSDVYFKKYYQAGAQPAPAKLRVHNLESGATTFIDLKTPRLVEAVAEAGNKVFLSGGINSFNETPMASQYVAELYDKQSKTTTALALRDSFIVTNALGLGKKIYMTGFEVIGGQQTRANTIRVYDVDNGSWTSINPPVNSQTDLLAAIDGKLAYTNGGSIRFYDPQTNQTASTPIPHANLNGRALTVAGNLLILAGGVQVNSSNYADDVDVYNVRTNTWTSKKLAEKKAQASAAVAGNLVLVAGGSTAPTQTTNKTDFFKLTN